MIRRMSIAILAAAALAGCATGYGYRGGSGDYYYGRGGGYDYYDYGTSYYGYGGYGHGYGSPYSYYGGYGYPYAYYGYPYYYYPRPPGHDHGDGPDNIDRSQRRHPYPGLPDKSGVDRGTLTVGPQGPDAARSRIRDPQELRSGSQFRQPAPAARQPIGRPVRSLPPPRTNPGRSAPAPRPAPVRSEAPRRSAPVPLRSESPRRDGPRPSRGGGRRAVPL